MKFSKDFKGFSQELKGFSQDVMKFSQDIGIDLGTANTLVFVNEKGVVIREPSVVARNNDTGEIVAVGNDARDMIGRTPENIEIIRPLKNGVVADYETTAAMLNHFLKAARKERSALTGKPNVVICVPTSITEIEERAVIDAAKQSGAKEAYTISEPFAAAIGIDLPVWEPTGSMIVDIGGGTTEVAVFSLGGVITSRSIPVAGNNLDAAIIKHVRQTYNLMIGEKTAEEIKKQIGSAIVTYDLNDMEVSGRDLLTGLPETKEITSEEISLVLKDGVDEIVNAIKVTLEKTPPELSADIMDRGIVLTGGGALLKNLAELISQETEIPVFVAENPLDSVVIGTGKSLEHMQHFRTNPNISSQRTNN